MSIMHPLQILCSHWRTALKALAWTVAALLLAAIVLVAVSWYKNPSLKTVSAGLETPDTVHIGSLLTYTVNVEAPFYRIPDGRVEISLPDGLQTIGEHNIKLKQIGLFTWTWGVTCNLQPIKTGTLEGGSVDIFFTPSRTEKDTNSVSEIPAVKVVSLLNEGEGTHVSSLPLVETGKAAPPAWLYWLGMSVLGILVLGVLLAVFLNHDGENMEAIAVNPDEDAHDKLETLRAELPLKAEHFFVRLTDIVREYLEDKFRVRATEQATAEFLRDINESSFLTDEQKTQLTDVLKAADLVKFARADTSREQMEEALQKAEQLVEQLNRDSYHSQQ